LLDHQLDAFLPLYRATRRWEKRCPVSLDLPLFPGYIFVHVVTEERGKVLRIPGVVSLVGSRCGAWPLDESIIESLRSGLHFRNAQPYRQLAIGERVRIIHGALKGLVGVLLHMKNNIRVGISLDQIMQSITVDVDADEVEPAINQM
jgi:transcriptional antiterminator RfaH